MDQYRQMLAQLQGAQLRDEPLAPVEHAGEITGLLYGWRSFSMISDQPRGRVKLRGSKGYTWESAQYTAKCDNRLDRAEEHLRSAACQCGIYLMREPVREMAEVLFDTEIAVALCLMWGEVVEAEHGYRAQHVRIERLFVNGKNPYLLMDLHDRYGIPVDAAQEYAQVLIGWHKLAL